LDAELKKIASAKEEWAKKFKLGSKGKIILDELDTEIEAAYTPADIEGVDYLNSLGFPGQYPFTRGPYPEMSRHAPWRYSIFSGFGCAEDTNTRWKLLYEAGQRSFNLAPDLPTHLGFDSDHPMAEEEVGRVGMSVDTLKDMEILFEGLPIDEVPFSTNVEALAPVIIAMYIAVAEIRGVELSKLSGTISNDPLSTAAGKQTVVFPLTACVRLSADLIEFCSRHLPRFYPIKSSFGNSKKSPGN
jgi:methylmalonyl-CoA mutase N-terminal domain/subunit